MIPQIELERRYKALQSELEKIHADGALVVQRADALYFSGTAQNIHVYIPVSGKPVVFAYRDVERSKNESPWEVVPLKGISTLSDLIQAAGYAMPERLGLELDVLPVAHFERYKRVFPDAEMVDISQAIRKIRAVKSEWEIEKMEKGGEIYQTLIKDLPNIIKPGMSEIELESLLEMRARLLGHETLVRMRGFNSEFHFGGVLAGERAGVGGYFDGPIVGLGVSYAHPIGPSHTPIKNGEPIIMDLAIMIEGYLIDQTRTAVLGKLSPELYKAYETALTIDEMIREKMVPGRVSGEIYQEILSFVEKETPYRENFMGWGDNRVKFIGHGVGLELDEMPVLCRGGKDVLQAGMTIAVEPKFVFPNIGAVGIENTYAVGPADGARCLCPVSRGIIHI